MRGHLRIAVLLGSVVLGGCSSSSPSNPASPVSPSAPVAFEGPFNGVWQVTTDVTECGGMRGCWATVGKSVAATLRIFHMGDTVEGTVVIADKLFDVRGTATADELRVSGQQGSGGGCAGASTLSEFVLTRMEAGWTGRFAWTSTKPFTCNISEYQVSQGARVVTATRASTQVYVPEFTGSWGGFGTTVACLPDDVVKVCYSNTGCVDLEARPLTVVCESGTRHDVGVGLTQSGQTVSGVLSGVPVTGTVSNGRVTLSGTLSTTLASLEPGTHIRTIPTSSFVLDYLGRMSGTYRVDREYIPKNGMPPYRWSQEERLDSVVIR
jgi:hypothetical protein